MSGPFELAPGSVIRVEPPTIPGVAVLPVPGPAGPAGPAWDDSAAVGELIDTAVTAHVVTAEPHPAYDDLPSFTLLYENGLI